MFQKNDFIITRFYVMFKRTISKNFRRKQFSGDNLKEEFTQRYSSHAIFSQLEAKNFGYLVHNTKKNTFGKLF